MIPMQLDSAGGRMSPLPARWASPLRVPDGIGSIGAVHLRRDADHHVLARQASPMQMRPPPARGIVFPGASVAPFVQGDVPEWSTHRRSFGRPQSPMGFRHPVQGREAQVSPLRVRAREAMVSPIRGSPHRFPSPQPQLPLSSCESRQQAQQPQEVSSWPPQISSEQPQSMEPGETISIGRLRVQMEQAIGEGAYAHVWCGRADGREVAVKEMRCGKGAGILPDASLQRACFEVKVMQLMTAEAHSGGAEIRVPHFRDCQFWDLSPAEPGAYLCRVAMTRKRGSPLVSWLQERITKKGKQPSSVLSASTLPASALYCSSFLDAARTAREMLQQLTPTFLKLNGSIAMHRDVNARNLLVHCPSDSQLHELTSGAAPSDASSLEFTLLDFGSSIDVHLWRGSGEGSWEHENPTGDARYWGPASWLRFLHGAEALVQEEGLKKQYTCRLDLFALAVCTLEVIAKLHTEVLPDEATRAPGGNQDSQVGLAAGIARMQNSWCKYWNLAVTSFEKLAEYSQLVCLGDQQRANGAWQDLSKDDIPRSLRKLLHELCGDLVSLASICRKRGAQCDGCEAPDAWSEVGEALEALHEMLHEGSSLEWPELAAKLRMQARAVEASMAVVPRRNHQDLSWAAVDDAAAGRCTPRAVVEATAAVSPSAEQQQANGVLLMDGHRSLAQVASMAFCNIPSGWSVGRGSLGDPSWTSFDDSAAGPCLRSPRHTMATLQQQPSTDLPQLQSRWQEMHMARQQDQHVTVPVLPLQQLHQHYVPQEQKELTPREVLEDQAAVRTPPVARQHANRAEEQGTGAVPAVVLVTAGRGGEAWSSPRTASPGDTAHVATATRAAASSISPRQSCPMSVPRLRSPSPSAAVYVTSPQPAWSSMHGASPASPSVPPGQVVHRPSFLSSHAPGKAPPEEKDQQALHVLRQVESEVRQLKQWYTDAIQAMRPGHQAQSVKSWEPHEVA
eukprot:TRINITY_DN25637_c0_g1_i2.p1 TRINITY_DN25637_c0_g1~~TRINITY_DN25637_c0_g1_i2.p1  ORF type:complete len:1048 (+),score=202.30 TRINITY_DN25637_c0_g1_i2:265-3144(+)